MSAVMILQARITSTRLPGKVLQEAAGRTILEWVVRGSRKVPGIDAICVAVPVGSEHDRVSDLATRLGVPVVRGPETDVLERFRIAAEVSGASEIMRVTTDCPMMDPNLCGAVLAVRRASAVDYACNNEPFGYPHGLDCEVFTRGALESAAANVTEAYDREHVTPWLRRQHGVSRAYVVGPGGERKSWRWTVDTPADLRFFCTVADALGDDVQDWSRVAAHLDANPNLHDINRSERQR